jgi:hypothetical protein
MDENNPVKDMLKGSYYYENTSVKSTKKYKVCNLCVCPIPVGSAHKGAKLFNDEFYQVNFCPACEETYANELSEMRSGKYDSY